ncbi:methionine--tRNA ligase [Candidatus Woesearchaeota archaeon]|nr:methionine--tRNA ligase [Candidatus Woesearchaeota archaeon]
MKETYYVTTAIAYPNQPPHAGHMLEFIQSDFVARYQRLLGKDVHFLTGTDEHGQKIVEAAKDQGLTTQELVEKNAKIFLDFTKFLNMSNDDFIRTTDQKRHWPSVVKLWNKLKESGDIYKKKYEGLYCVGCEKFVLERELVDGKCQNHNTVPKKLVEENYFFKLSKYAKKIEELISKDEIKVVPKTRKNEILSFLSDDVKDISFSRHKDSLTWGIPVPGDEDQVMYVWCDALTNYISALDYDAEGSLYKKYWPADVHVIGKDILRFHAAYWPAMHLSANIPVPKSIFVHGFLNSKGQKMSKSLGNVIDPYEQIEKYGLEQVRLYLLKNLPSYDDCDYSEEDLTDTVNSELADDLGNLIRRVIVLIEKNFSGNIPKVSSLEDIDKKLVEDSNFFEDFDEFMLGFEFNKALNKLWEFIRATNKYLTDTEPWKIKDKERLGTVLYNALEATRIISCFLYPAMPTTSEDILERIGQKLQNLNEIKFSTKTSGKINKKDEVLFRKIEVKKMESTFPLNLKVAKIVSAENHPDADKLLVLQLDLGSEKRQLVAGIKGYYSLEELVGKKIIMITNLKYAKLRGVESQGMLLAAEAGDVVEVLTTDAPEGTQVSAGNLENNEEQVTFEQFGKLKIVIKDGVPVFEDKVLEASGEKVFVTQVSDGAKVR